MVSLRSPPLVMLIGRPEAQIPVVSPSTRCRLTAQQRPADTEFLANITGSRVLDVKRNVVGGAVTVGLAHC